MSVTDSSQCLLTLQKRLKCRFVCCRLNILILHMLPSLKHCYPSAAPVLLCASFTNHYYNISHLRERGMQVGIFGLDGLYSAASYMGTAMLGHWPHQHM